MSIIKRVALLCALGLGCMATASAQPASATPTPELAKAASPTPAPTPSPASSVSPAYSPSKSSTTASTPPAKAALKAAAKGTPALPPEKSQPLSIPRFDAAPVIDGKLDDAIWKKAAVLKDFYQTNPGDNIAPTEPTEVFVGYDAKFLYLGFHCYDDPSKVRATVAKRDNVFGEDNVRVYLDTFNDQRRAYVLGWNPLGIQQDGIMTEAQGSDFSVDIVMESKGAITSDGYVVEVAIPFKSLRYEAGKGKLWGLHVWRNIDRNNDEIDSWMPMSRDASGTLNQAGHITGLEGISTERTIEMIPSFTVSETGKRVRAFDQARASIDPGHFVNQPVTIDPGLTAKFVMSSAATIDLAINPDFAQVEADATVNTANQRFPIFFDEKRPFFLEGIDIFRTQIAAVHTRTIIDPDFAAKLTGKRGRNTYGLLVASDNAPGDFTFEQRFDPEELPSAGNRIIGKNATIAVLRVKRDIGKENSIGFLATAYNFVNKSNYLGGFDSRIRFDKQTTLDFQVLGTNERRCSLGVTDDEDRCRTLNGFAYAYNLSQNKRHLGWNVNGVGRTAGYRAEVGFTRRVNTNSQNGNIWYVTEPKPKKKIVSWEFDSYLGGNHDWQGRMQNWNYEGQVGPNLQRQSFVRVGYNTGYERDFASEFGRTFFAGGRSERSNYSKNVFAYAGSTPTKKFKFFYFAAYRWGEVDYDFGAGPKFPRVSPSGLAQQAAELAGLCVKKKDDDVLPAVCLGPLDPGAGNLLYTNGSVTYKASSDLNLSLDFSKNRLVRNDTGRVAFDSNIVSLKTTYQFTRFAFARARIDYDSVNANVRGQFLYGWTPNPGTAFYVGYNDDMNRNFFNPVSGQPEPGFRRNGRTFFIKASYLFRRSF
ncbi:MAG: hypothetical protein QOC99_2652 [Acidobacteriota bacterium]|jgi:hypothetical protein|nr:hypothetical protein [Acidobacteriota bacterium]